MTRQLNSKKPPQLAAWAVKLFAPADQAESILGDLHEEFLQIGSKSGTVAARGWYWRQILTTIAHFAGSGFRGAPWSTAGAVIAGFFLLRFAHGLPDKLLTVLTDKYLMYWSNHFPAYLRLLKVMPIGFVIGSVFTGCIVALAARGREMIATMMLALVVCGMTTAGLVWALATLPGATSLLWNLPWLYSDPATIVLGGVIVQKLRSAAAMRASA
jgi:hypothetical protein